MNKITLHPYVSTTLVFVSLCLFAQNFYFIYFLYEFTKQNEMVAQDPQFMAELVRSGLTSLLYLGISVYFALSIAQKKPILIIEGHNTSPKPESAKPEKSEKLEENLNEKLAEKIEKKNSSTK